MVHNGIDGTLSRTRESEKERRIERRLSGARREPAPRLPQRAPLFAASPANARAFAASRPRKRGGRRRRGRMVVETPGGRVTRRPRGVSGERERGARASRASARRARAREPVVTYRARDRSHTLRAFARSGPWAGERAGGPTRGSRRERTDTPDRRRRRRRRRPRRPTVFQRLPPRLSPQRRETLRARPRRDDIIFLCRSPRKRGGGPRVLGRAARLTEGPLKPRSGPPLSLSERARGPETGARYIRKRSESVR